MNIMVGFGILESNAITNATEIVRIDYINNDGSNEVFC